MADIKLEKGITFGDKHSYRDYSMILQKSNIGLPSKEKIIERPPFSSEQVDFSLLFGDQPYSTRELAYTFVLFTHHNRTRLEAQRLNCVDWLMGINQESKLYDDDIRGFYFKAEVQDEIVCEFDSASDTYEITVTFVAYPFKTSILPDAHDIWDEVYFDTHVWQKTSFTVPAASNIEINLYNTGVTTVYPKIKIGGDPPDDGTYFNVYTFDANSNMIGHLFNVGEHEDTDVGLKPGENTLLLANQLVGGPATFDFEWYKEVL